jgi:hypothetical protein
MTSTPKPLLFEAQNWVLGYIQNIIVVFQTHDTKSLQEGLEQVLRGKSEASSLVFLILEYLFNKSGTSFFGKSLLAINGFDLLSYALESYKPLEKVDFDANGLTFTLLGMIGSGGCLASVVSPEKHKLFILLLALSKISLGFFLAKGANDKFLIMARHHARSGLVVLLFLLLSLWRERFNETGSENAEFRLSKQIEQLVSVVKDQTSRLDAMLLPSPNPSTPPKKYI